MLGEIPTLVVVINEFLFFLIHYPIWVKFGIRGLRLMLLSVYEFGESRRRETVFS